MKNIPQHMLFVPSGCLSREGLLLFELGKLNAQETALVKAHLQTCELCALAAEGLAMADPQEFKQDLETIYASLKEVEVPEELQQSEENTVKSMPPPKKSFFRMYRLEMIAAALLLLLVISARQIYVGLLPEKRQSDLARIEPENVDEMEVIQQEITTRERRGEERLKKRPTPLKPVEISVVSDDQKDISAPGTEPSHNNAQRMAALDASEEKHNASGAEMQMQEEQELDGVEIFSVAEQAPEFPGGDKKRIEFLTENIKYPDEARELGVQGTVYIGFVVEKDGSITNTRVLRGIGKGCEEEAFRAIRMMPKWKPGTQSRQPVRMQVNMPVTFTLSK